MQLIKHPFTWLASGATDGSCTMLSSLRKQFLQEARSSVTSMSVMPGFHWRTTEESLRLSGLILCSFLFPIRWERSALLIAGEKGAESCQLVLCRGLLGPGFDAAYQGWRNFLYEPWWQTLMHFTHPVLSVLTVGYCQFLFCPCDRHIEEAALFLNVRGIFLERPG